jgi:DNA-binding MarR family transcriptional regulator
VTLNIDATKKKAGITKGRPRPLVDEVVDELTAWNPREFIAAFQRWHQGAISLIQLNVLALLEATGPLPMSRLAEALDISVASITGVVDRMEARGFVERRRDSDDRRVITVQPADGARQLFADIDKRRRAGLGALLAALSEDELRGLLAGHRALRAARAELARRASVDVVDAMARRAKATTK